MIKQSQVVAGQLYGGFDVCLIQAKFYKHTATTVAVNISIFIKVLFDGMSICTLFRLQ